MNNETWLPVVGYENLYEVSSLGRVRSLGARARVLRTAKDHCGYLHVGLSKNRKSKGHLVHRLVATAHIPNPLNLPQVNHKNECKTDNRVVNLEWCDAHYNCTYGTLADKIVEKSMEVYQYDINGTFVAWYPSANEAARQTGLHHSGISQCARGKCYTFGNFQWSYTPALFLDATEGRLNNAKSKRVYQYDAQTGCFIKEWVNAAEVHRQTGWHQSAIGICCKGKRNQAHGFRWFYSFQGLHINV